MVWNWDVLIRFWFMLCVMFGLFFTLVCGDGEIVGSSPDMGGRHRVGGECP